MTRFLDSEISTINCAFICRNRCWHLIKAKDNKYKITITVNSLLAEIGCDLRGEFDGVNHTFSDFYPYWKHCKPKYRMDSFKHLKFIYDSSFNLMDKVEKSINKKLFLENNW